MSPARSAATPFVAVQNGTVAVPAPASEHPATVRSTYKEAPAASATRGTVSPVTAAASSVDVAMRRWRTRRPGFDIIDSALRGSGSLLRLGSARGGRTTRTTYVGYVVLRRRGSYARRVADDPLLSIAEELYSLPPGEFTGTRNQWAKQTKGDGDAELAKRVTELRKPSVAAWVVNMLMRHQGDQMSQVLDLGASLRQAQSDLDGDALRELTRQRRQLTTAVTRQGRTLAGELGQKVTEAVADQVQDTLHAAMVDEDAAAAVRSGLLVSALAATGVGSADVVDAVAVPAAIGMTPRPRAMPERKRPELSVVPEPEPAPDEAEREREAARSAARAEVDRAVSEADEARRKVRKAEKRVGKVQARTLQAAEELEEARGRVAELEHELESLDDDAAAAEEKKEKAAERYVEAQEVLEQKRAALDRL